MLLDGVFYLFDDLLNAVLIVINVQGRFDDKRLHHAFLFESQAFFVKRTAESVNYNGNHNGSVLFDDVRRALANWLK